MISTGVSSMRARIFAMIQPTARPIARPPTMAPTKVPTPTDALNAPPTATAIAML